MADENQNNNDAGNTGTGENQVNQSDAEKAAAAVGAGDGKELEQDSQELADAEKFILEFKDEDWQDENKVTQLQDAHKLAKTSINQKYHWRTKAQTLEKGSKQPSGKENNNAASQDQAASRGQDDTVSKVAFRQDHPDVPKEVVQEIFLRAKATGEDPEVILEKPMVQSYIKSLKDKDEALKASPKPSKAEKMSIPNIDWKNASSEDVNKTRDAIRRNARR